MVRWGVRRRHNGIVTEYGLSGLERIAATRPDSKSCNRGGMVVWSLCAGRPLAVDEGTPSFSSGSYRANYGVLDLQGRLGSSGRFKQSSMMGALGAVYISRRKKK